MQCKVFVQYVFGTVCIQCSMYSVFVQKKTKKYYIHFMNALKGHFRKLNFYMYHGHTFFILIVIYILLH